MAVMEAAQLKRYHAAYPHMVGLLSQMSDEDCQKVVNQKDSPKATTVRSQALQVMMEPYLPPSFTQVGKNIVYKDVRPVSNMSPRAAKGMVEAARRGYLGDNLIWLTIHKQYPRIAATAEKSK